MGDAETRQDTPSRTRHGGDGRALAFVMLTMVALSWAANTNVARAFADEIPPMALTFWRLFLSALILAPFAARACWAQRREIRRHFRSLSLYALLSMSAFNALLYGGLQVTQAINGNLVQGALPICILTAGALFAGRHVTARQWTGVLLGLAGLVVIVIRGDLQALLGLGINIGDPIVLCGVFASASYAATLHRRSDGLALIPFMFMMMALGTLQIVPFFVVEHAFFRPLPMTATNVGVLVFMAMVPSVMAQLFFFEGIRRVGAATAGYMIYLTPVFGVLGAVLVLGEAFHGFHAAGIALIAAGIWLATVTRKPAG